MSSEHFEQLVVQLLVAMGYGGSLQDAGEAVGKSGDEGIDGIIKEDKLGLDNIYVQAKKWVNTTVGRPTVQAFTGSLEGHRARKGVMITTSSFSDDARRYVQKIEKKIVLIDGKRLAQLMIDHSVGVTVTKVQSAAANTSDTPGLPMKPAAYSLKFAGLLSGSSFLRGDFTSKLQARGVDATAYGAYFPPGMWTSSS